MYVTFPDFWTFYLDLLRRTYPQLLTTATDKLHDTNKTEVLSPDETSNTHGVTPSRPEAVT